MSHRTIKVWVAYSNEHAFAATRRSDAIDLAWDEGNLDAYRVVAVEITVPRIADTELSVTVPAERIEAAAT